eukprot:15276779-Alexandrium_andersonii.AAC.1
MPFDEHGMSTLSCGHVSRPCGKSAASRATRGVRKEPRPNCTNHPESGPLVMKQCARSHPKRSMPSY